MDAVTYPNANVISFLTDNFVCAHFNTAEPTPEIKQIQRSLRQVWTPTLVFFDHHQIETRRLVGYFPPEEFLAELRFALGTVDMLHAKYADAFTRFRSVVDGYPQAKVAPEAVYWAGVAALQRDGKPDPLLDEWRELRDRFPESSWWSRASFVAEKL